MTLNVYNFKTRLRNDNNGLKAEKTVLYIGKRLLGLTVCLQLDLFVVTEIYKARWLRVY